MFYDHLSAHSLLAKLGRSLNVKAKQGNLSLHYASHIMARRGDGEYPDYISYTRGGTTQSP